MERFAGVDPHLLQLQVVAYFVRSEEDKTVGLLVLDDDHAASLVDHGGPLLVRLVNPPHHPLHHQRRQLGIGLHELTQPLLLLQQQRLVLDPDFSLWKDFQQLVLQVEHRGVYPGEGDLMRLHLAGPEVDRQHLEHGQVSSLHGAVCAVLRNTLSDLAQPHLSRALSVLIISLGSGTAGGYFYTEHIIPDQKNQDRDHYSNQRNK